MPNLNIRSSECAWQDAEVKLLGRTIQGLRGWDYKKTVEKDYVYGSGNEPLDINDGNKKYEGNIKILGFELDTLNKVAVAAGYDDITEVPHEAIVIVIKFQKSKLDPKTFVTINGVGFKETGGSMEQGAKMREVTLPWIAMNITTI